MTDARRSPHHAESRSAQPRAGRGATERSIEALIALARPAQRIVAFTGAGISTESGIPDYRSPGGVWERQAMPTLDDFVGNPETQRAYWQRRRTSYPELADARPNDGHLALAALEQRGRLTQIITQNIDGLHQKAGNSSKRVIELHGSAHTIRCMDCRATWPADTIQSRLAVDEEMPLCEVCGGALRAATILFGESLPVSALKRATEAAQSCDLMLVVGSSLVVNPAAQLPVLAKRAGARLAIINRTPTPLDALADIHINTDSGLALATLAAALAE